MRAALLVLAKHWQALAADERVLEQQIAKTARQNQDARRLMEVPGVGPIIASTVLAKVPDPKLFRSRPRLRGLDRAHRERPRHRRQASPRPHLQTRDRVLRALLMRGQRATAPAESARRQRSLVVRVAGAAALQSRDGNVGGQTARILWAMLAKGDSSRDRASAPAAA
jgi:transposase